VAATPVFHDGWHHGAHAPLVDIFHDSQAPRGASAKVLRHFGSLALGMPYLTTMIRQLLAISAGASVGACLRWLLGQGLNALFPAIPPGTLVANLLGGYLIGVALGFFGQHIDLAPEWKLLVITGFLGGLTTFSTFSAEVTGLLQHGRLLWAACAIGVHVAGSLVMTVLGLMTVGAWQRF